VSNLGRYLIARRKIGEKLAGMWEFPGGKVEVGESLQECLKREMLEELNVDADVGDVIAESHYKYDHGEILLVAMDTKLSSKELRLTVHDQVEWLHPDQLLKLNLAPADIPIARFLLERTNGN
jgi:8-oxo-dGTP diphosphatase